MQLEKLAEMVVLTIKSALSPVLAQVAALDARVTVLGDVRDRVVTLETKALAPVFEPAITELATLREQLSVVVKENSLLRERVGILEVRQQIPGPAGKDGVDGKPGTDGLHGKDGAPGVDGLHGKDGAPGLNGKDGADGLHGKDGLDGLGWDELAVVADPEDERTAIFRCAKGLQVKEVGRVTIPAEIFRGVYLIGKTYERGDVVTWDGSSWHANKSTTAKPGESKDWTLKVKRGNEGKPGRDGQDLRNAPVVTIGRHPANSDHFTKG